MHTLIYIFSPLISLNGWAVECALVRSHTSYKIFPQVIKIWKFIIKFIIFWDKNDDERECNSNSSRKIARTNGRESGKKGERSVEWRKQQQRLPNRIWTDAKYDCSLSVSLTFYFTSLRSLRALHLWEQCNFFAPKNFLPKLEKWIPFQVPVSDCRAHIVCVCVIMRSSTFHQILSSVHSIYFYMRAIVLFFLSIEPSSWLDRRLFAAAATAAFFRSFTIESRGMVYKFRCVYFIGVEYLKSSMFIMLCHYS